MQFLQAVLLTLLACALINALKPHFDASSPYYTNANINPANLDLATLFVAQAEPVSNETHSHERRWAGPPPAPAGDDIWNTAKCKGRKFMAQMSWSDFDAGQALPVPANTVESPWRYNDLLPWGYYFSGVTTDYSNLETGGYWGVADLFRHMGISDRCEQDGGQWYAGSFTHYKPGPPGYAPEPRKNQQTYVDPHGVTRKMTGALFYMAINPFVSAILVQNTLGPKPAAASTHAPNSFPDSELPELGRLSDMMWAMYEYYVKAEDWHKIDFFMSLAISNPTSMALIRRALDSEGQVLSTAPYKFEPGSEGFLAILGSPNGARVAHFLTQRKNYIGLKTVASIYVLQCASKSGAACLMFRTQALAQAVPRPKDQAQPGKQPDADPNAPVGPPDTAVKRQEKREFLRVHTFRLSANRNVTSSSEYT